MFMPPPPECFEVPPKGYSLIIRVKYLQDENAKLPSHKSDRISAYLAVDKIAFCVFKPNPFVFVPIKFVFSFVKLDANIEKNRFRKKIEIFYSGPLLHLYSCNIQTPKTVCTLTRV